MNFEAYTPPRINESELKKRAAARLFRNSIITLAVGTLLTLVAMLIFCSAVIRIFPKWGLLSLIVPVGFVFFTVTVMLAFVILQTHGKLYLIKRR